MATETAPSAGYWYGDMSDADETDAMRILDALGEFRTASITMRKRARDSMDLNETDFAALRYVVTAKSKGRSVTPTDLMKNLGVTMASVTVLIDRLERGDHLRREINPDDRRSRLVTSTPAADAAMGAFLASMRHEMTTAAGGMAPSEVDCVVALLHRLQRAADAVAPVV